MTALAGTARPALASGRRASVGYTQTAADYPTVAQPSFLSVLVVFDGDMPVPSPAADGVPEDAVIRSASAEYLVQLATRSRASDD